MQKILEKNYILIIFCFFFSVLAAKGLILVVPDLNILYPYMAPDSYDWIANGLHYAGYDVSFSLLRPPGLPLIIALLQKLDLLPFLPLINQLCLFGILGLIYKILNIFFDKTVSVIAVSILFFNFFLQNISLFILADIYSLFFILLGFCFYLKAGQNDRHYIFASLFWAASFLFQYAFISLAPAFLAHFFLFRRKIRLKTALLSILPVVFLATGWILFKKANASVSGTAYFGLLKPHLDSVFFYFIGIVSVFGIFAFFLLVAGNIIFFLNKRRLNPETRKFIYLNLLAAASWLIFWVLLYDWNDRRFILYLIPFLLPFAAIAIRSGLAYSKKGDWLSKGFFFAVIALCAVWSAIPYESIFSFNSLKITGASALQFDMTIDPNSFKGNISPSSWHLTENRSGFNPINLPKLISARNIDRSELKNLNNIQARIREKGLKSLCVTSADSDKAQWYIISNRYGNFFKMKIYAHPLCPEPNARIENNHLELI